jgi:hypothetical protein
MMMNSSGGAASGYPANWSEMSPAQKRKWRLDRQLNAEHIPFVSAEAKKKYQTRAKRTVAYYNIEEFDKVPTVRIESTDSYVRLRTSGGGLQQIQRKVF